MTGSARTFFNDNGVLILLALARLLLHMLTNGQYGFHRDELATLDDARYLAWGYVAYPPMAPFIAYLARELFGTSLVGVRFFSALAQSIAMAGTAYATFEPARYAMGDTLHYAERLQLIDMLPRGELSTTGYVLANPGAEYLVLQPSETVEPFKLELAAGTYTVEWHSVNNRETVKADTVTVERATTISLRAPFAAPGSIVVYLRKVAG
jgi:hypothetical protein